MSDVPTQTLQNNPDVAQDPTASMSEEGFLPELISTPGDENTELTIEQNGMQVAEFRGDHSVLCSQSSFSGGHVVHQDQNHILADLQNQPRQTCRAPLTQAERQRSRRTRIRAEKGQKRPASSTERSRRCRERQSLSTNSVSEVNNSAPCDIDDEPMRDIIDDEQLFNDHVATAFFRREFIEDEFGHACNVCDRLWFKKDLKRVKEAHCATLYNHFGSECKSFMLCSTCFQSLNKNRIPSLSVTNGFRYPPKPAGLPNLNPISIRLISPRIPFMNIRRLQRDGNHGIIGQVINIPIDINSMVRQLPRSLDDDYAINVSIKRKLFHKSSYLSGSVKKSDLKVWLDYLVKQPLYMSENIQIDWRGLDNIRDEDQPIDNELIEDISESAPEHIPLLGRQQTLLWNEDSILDIAPGQNSRPMNLIFDPHAEELSFPHIYYGHGRSFSENVQVTPFMIASSEIRRRDRRGASPEHILYMAMTILRRRVVDGMRSSFRRVSQTEGITRRMIEDKNFRNECVEKNLAFLKSIPNSSQYWKSKKQDLFGMIHQLGKPTIFMTLSANEMNWPNLIRVLHRLNRGSTDVDLIDPLSELDRSTRSNLVNEDPVTCCIYFKKLVDVLLRMFKSEKDHNPLGRYRMIDHFMRIEFQHRGSPHAHILMWLENDPKEPISENMPETVKLMNYLCSVSDEDIPPELYKNQVHKHTFTCTKRGETSCRFHIPFWPTKQSCVLLPLHKDDRRRNGFKATASKVKKALEEKVYSSFDHFLNDVNLSYEDYLDIIRSTLKRPVFLHKREPSQIMTNAFNSWIAKVLMSNMDLQIILDIYSCANYVVDYVNKAGRGISNLHREIIKLSQQYPDVDREGLLKKLAAKVLNSVEMSASEGAWYLLRQPMSHASRECIYIPTCHPAERQKSHKSQSQLEQIELDSTDVWTKNIIQKYEERPRNLESLCLADFAAYYTSNRLGVHGYSRRKIARIIRCRNYDQGDTENFKREMVTLYIPFRNEQADILDRLRFLQIYEANLDQISLKRKEYEAISNMEQIVEEMKRVAGNDCELEIGLITERHQGTQLANGPNNSDEVPQVLNTEDRYVTNAVTVVRERRNVLPKADYCKLMRTTNIGQRRLLHHAIHLLTLSAPQPLQIFFTGPAGCGKTYVLKLLMETYNRYSQISDEESDSYLACASTGKAAINLGGITVHSALHITSSSSRAISFETIHKLRDIYRSVNCVIVDEVSMIGSSILHQINERLGQITRNTDELFGSISIIFCGDFKQLPPVHATPVYRASKNHLHGNLLWQSLEYHCLDQVMRQSDETFSSILTKIGNGLCLTSSESQLIESRFREESWCNANLQGVTRLFHENYLVENFNENVLQGARTYVANHSFSGYSTHQELTKARARAHQCPPQEASGLAYSVLLKEGFPYMITTNIDVQDGLANGAIGKLRFIEEWTTVVRETEEKVNIRVWLEFDSDKIGVQAREKQEGHVRRHPDLIEKNWTPIMLRSSSLDLGGVVKCRRTQLPLIPACALTIHKSQGGTFDRAVISYHKNLSNQLVYVALSRVESLDGLFLTNPKNDFVFHTKNGCNTPTMKEIKDEYERLSRHRLKTRTDEIIEFLDARDESSHSMIISTINAQSLVAHFEDIQSDEVLMKSDFLVITETWMDDASKVAIKNFQLISQAGNDSRWAMTSTNAPPRRVAGGVAIYKNKSSIDYTLLPASDNDVQQDSVGDALTIRMSLRDGKRFVLTGFYIHPGSTKARTESFIKQALRGSAVASETSVMLTGDFNSNIMSDNWLVEMIERELDLKYVTCDLPTTLGNTKIDLSFVRGVRASCRAFVAYFSYHRPLIHKLYL